MTKVFVFAFVEVKVSIPVCYSFSEDFSGFDCNKFFADCLLPGFDPCCGVVFVHRTVVGDSLERRYWRARTAIQRGALTRKTSEGGREKGTASAPG